VADLRAPEAPKRWVLVSMIHGAILRAEHEIEELKAGGLFVRDASGPEDSHAADGPAPSPPTVPKPLAPAGAPAGDKPAG
jgi:hypothetical protein